VSAAAAAEPDFSHNFDLVCEGGGVKGIGLAGAYAVLEERGYKPQSVAGTSAGAITAALIAAGYSSKEIDEIVFGMDFRRFEDESWEDKLPGALGKGLSILLERGVYKGEEFLTWIRGLLEAKDVRTFKDLPSKAPNSKFAHRLQVIVSDLSSRRLLVLPRDADLLGLKPDDLEVAEAVRMSMSIPLFFEPVEIQNAATNHLHLLVDGGILSNFPIWLFDSEGRAPRWPTFGLLLVEPDPKTPITERLPEPEHAPRGFKAVTELLTGIVHTVMEAHDRMYVEKAQYARTIPIPTVGVRTTEFDLTHARARELYDSGRAAAETFLETWNFDAYIAEFRTGKEHSRREDIAASLGTLAAPPPG
jgi:NTE family protein